MNNGNFIAILFISNFISPTFGELKPINYDVDGLMAPCVLRLCEKYFRSERSLSGSLAIINLVPLASVVQARILKSFNEDEDHKIGVLTKASKRPHRSSRLQEKAQNYLMLLQHYDDFGFTLRQVFQLPTWNPLAQFVVQFTIPFKDEKTFYNWTRRIFDELFEVDCLRVNILYTFSNDTERIGVITWFPYYNQSCPSKVQNIKKVEECYGVTSTNNATGLEEAEHVVNSFHQDLYPMIPKKLHFCKLRVSAVVWEPFVVATTDILTDNYAPTVDKGLEILMLKTIASQMELTLTLHPYKAEKITKVITNDSYRGLYADLMKKRSDVMVGGLYENVISRRIASSSIPYYQDDITWCVAKAGFAPKWLNVFIIFNYSTWIALFITLLFTSGILFVFARFEGIYRENYAWAFLIMFNLSTAQPAHYDPIRSSIKIFFAGFFFFGLHISTAYHSYLINVLTNPRLANQVSSVNEAIKFNMTFLAAENNAEFFKKNDSISQYLFNNFVVCKKLDDCFMDVTKDSSKAVAISRSHALNNPMQLNDAEDFSCFPVEENVVIYSAVMIFRKFYHLLPMINENIRIIAESGLLSKWEVDSLKVGKKEEDPSASSGHGSKTIKLSIEHVEGAFYLVTMGLGLSLLVFGLEWSVFYVSKKNSHWKYLKKFESLICHSK